ncbi:hypothetical protein BH10BAC3_BH10BAC3_06280 [soil metagenome]
MHLSTHSGDDAFGKVVSILVNDIDSLFKNTSAGDYTQQVNKTHRYARDLFIKPG